MTFSTKTPTADQVRGEEATRNEDGYVVTTDVQTVSSGGGTLALTLENPADSGVTAVVQRAVASSQFEASARVYDGFSTAPSGGTSLTPDNRLLDTAGAPTPGNMNARRDDTFTADTTQEATVFGGGGGGNPVGGAAGAVDFYLEPGRAVVFELVNESAANDDGALTMSYFEDATVYSTS